MELALSLVSMLGVSIGQILFRLSAERVDSARWAATTLGNPWLWLAVMVYVFATALWIHVLRTAPLARVYPWFALAFVVVPLLEAWLLGEPLRMQVLVGGMVIIVGVAIAVRGASA
jgi:drug/metabolite transporter (DMT)-like permease